MREKKFKAWNNIKQEWVYLPETGDIDLKQDLEYIEFDCEDIIILEYIGRNDKNGQPIYEDSSIVKFKFMSDNLDEYEELIGIFYFNEDSLRYEIEIFNNNKYVVLNYFDNGQMYDFEIIGTKQESVALWSIV